jgi:hypothetical protein
MLACEHQSAQGASWSMLESQNMLACKHQSEETSRHLKTLHPQEGSRIKGIGFGVLIINRESIVAENIIDF